MATQTTRKTTTRTETAPTTTTRNEARSTRTTGPTQEQIAARAYELFLARGGVHGYDQQDWLQAERELTLGRQ